MAFTRAKFALPDDEVDAAPGGFGIHTSVDSVPGAPTSPTAVAGVESATVSFTPPVDTGSGIRSYTVFVDPGDAEVVGPASPITVTGLETGLAYAFRVAARTSGGLGPKSELTDQVEPT